MGFTGRLGLMRTLFATALALMVALASISGTGQAGDVLRWKGKTYVLETNPLDGYLRDHHGALVRGDVISTANWRGYVATWQIDGSRLLLTDVEVEFVKSKSTAASFETEQRSVLSQMFPGRNQIPAEWYSGHLIVPAGRLLRYVHMGYASLYSKYLVFRVVKGEVVERWKMDAGTYSKFRREQFARYKQTPEFRESLRALLKDGDTESSVEAFLYDVAVEEYMSMVFDGIPSSPPEKRQSLKVATGR